MPLYIPKLRYDARPPLNWPIQPSWRVSLQGLGIVIVLSFCHFVLLTLLFGNTFWPRIANDAYVSVRPNLLTPVQRYVILTICDTFTVLTGAFFFTANLMLQRSVYLLDRYSGYTEYGKLLLTGVVGCLFGIDFTALSFPPSTAVPIATLTPYQCLSSTFMFGLYNVLPLFIGLHFAYGDSSPVLQSFGLKWSSPSSWRHCRGTDYLIGLGIILFGTLSLVLIGVHLPLQAGYHRYMIYGLYGMMVLVFFVLSMCVLSSRYTMHLHHYFCVGLLLPLTSSSNTVSRHAFVTIGNSLVGILPLIKSWAPLDTTADTTIRTAFDNHPSTIVILTGILQSVLFGVMIDGIAVWGMDPLWIPRTDDPKDGYSLETLQRSDTTTLVWLHMLPVISSPLSYCLFLDELRSLYASVEPIILARYGNDERWMDDSCLVFLPRRQNVEHDFSTLSTWLNYASVKKKLSQYSPYNPLQRENLRKVLVDRLQSTDSDAAYATFCALLRTLYLGPYAGSRELRLQCRLHCNPFSIRIQQTQQSLRKYVPIPVPRTDSQSTDSTDESIEKYFSFSPALDTEEETFTNMHQKLRKSLDAYESELSIQDKLKESIDTKLESSAYIYWSTQKLIIDYLEYCERTVRFET